MKKIDLLPIGTIVLLKNNEKKMMITGLLQTLTEKDDTVKEYDYLAVPYPEGFVDKRLQFLFNQEDIADIHYMGYIDVDYQDLMEKLSEEFGN